MSKITVGERVADDVHVLDVHGSILFGDETLRQAVNGLLARGDKRILLNLADVPYVDSAGLGQIVRCFATVSREGGRLKLLAPTDRVQRLLLITKLHTVFEIHGSEAEAVASFGTHR